MMESTILPQLGPAPSIGADAPTMAPGIEAHARSSKPGPVARRANRRAQAAQWCPAPFVPELVASQPPAPDPSLAHLKKKDKFPSSQASRVEGHKPLRRSPSCGVFLLLLPVNILLQNPFDFGDGRRIRK